MSKDTEHDRWQSTPQTWSVLKEPAREHRHKSTLAERVLWEHIRGSKLNGVRFRRQHAIGLYIVDFYAAVPKLVVEVDGEIHQQQEEYDRARDEYLRATGLRVLRFTNEQVVNQTGEVIGRISAECAASPLRRRRGE